MNRDNNKKFTWFNPKYLHLWQRFYYVCKIEITIVRITKSTPLPLHHAQGYLSHWSFCFIIVFFLTPYISILLLTIFISKSSKELLAWKPFNISSPSLSLLLSSPLYLSPHKSSAYPWDVPIHELYISLYTQNLRAINSAIKDCIRSSKPPTLGGCKSALGESIPWEQVGQTIKLKLSQLFNKSPSPFDLWS